jgi:hypothetical protein
VEGQEVPVVGEVFHQSWVEEVFHSGGSEDQGGRGFTGGKVEKAFQCGVEAELGMRSESLGSLRIRTFP